MGVTVAPPMRPEAAAEASDETARYVPGLDGLRALAVVAAMAFHAGILRGGFLGVDLFFVVSGFLITGLLLDDAADHGRVRLARFWARRVRRLAPALLLVLAVTLVWAYLAASPSMAQTTTRQLGWSLAYLGNWFALFGDVGYWGADAAKTPLNHLWSLAIEEQFYVVWPLVVVGTLAVTRRRRALGALAAAGIVGSAAWQAWVASSAGTERAYLGTDTRAVALLVGCLLAVAVGRSPGGAPRAAGRGMGGRALEVAAVVAAAGLAWSWVAADLERESLYAGWLQACSLAAGVVVAVVVTRPTSWYARALSHPALVWVGLRSYSLYLWHWPLWVMLSPAAGGRAGAGLWVVRIVATVVVSAASYAWVEQPIRQGRLSGRQLMTGAGVGAAALATAVLLFPPSLPPALRSGAVTLGGSRAGGGPEILVAGDSWARNLGFALAAADPEGRNTYLNLGVGGCGLMTGTDEGCIERQLTAWRDVLANRRPDAVLLVTGTIDQASGTRVGEKDVRPCDRAWDSAYARKLDQALELLRGPDRGPGEPRIPVYLTNVRVAAAARPEAPRCVNRLLTAAAERHQATVLDLNAKLCPNERCLATYEERPIYDDTGHLNPVGQRWIGGWILDVLQRDITPGGPEPAPETTGPCRAGSGSGVTIPVASYTSRPDGAYPDSGRPPELTDGQRGKAEITDSAWQGWRTGDADVVLNLRGTEPVCAVETSWLQVLEAAVQPPPVVEVYVSDAPGKLGTRLGATTIGQPSQAEQTVTARVSADAPVTGRFVIIRFRPVSDWSFADEVTAYGLPAG